MVSVLCFSLSFRLRRWPKVSRPLGRNIGGPTKQGCGAGVAVAMTSLISLLASASRLRLMGTLGRRLAATSRATSLRSCRPAWSMVTARPIWSRSLTPTWRRMRSIGPASATSSRPAPVAARRTAITLGAYG